MRNLLALLLFVPSLCFAQVPDYLPSEGLVAWYPFNGNANDQSGNGNDGVVTNATLTQDRMGEENSAFYFDGNGFIEIESLNAMEYNPITYSAWVMDGTEYLDTTNFHARTIMGREQTGNYHQGAICYYNEPAAGIVNQLNYYIGNPPFPDHPVANHPYVIGSWTHLVFSLMANGEFSWFVNGALTNTGTLSVEQYVELPFRIGSSFNRFFWLGKIDDCGIWDRTLNSAEVLALYTGTPPTFGCTNALACNYDPMANSDDGSCVSCEVLASACGEGTVWDSTLQECVTDLTFPTAPCGEGTVWDPVNEECIIAIPADLNYDGCISVNDLLVLLAVHGTCPPYPEWPDEPTDTTWACGDPVTYWDYDYATVLIGDQCWFAENLRTEQYVNGDSIPSNFSGSDWQWLNTGATSTYGENGSCNHESPIIDACDPSESLAAHGRLYNWYGVDDIRGICPMDWHVPDNEEWDTLISVMGGVQLAVNSLKSPTGWANGENGSNSSGFNGKPGGQRDVPGGAFEKAGARGRWWSTSNFSVYGWTRGFSENSNEVESYAPNMKDGFSIRCIKD